MNTSLTLSAHQFPIAIGSLENYLRAVQDIPLLSQKEEQDLAVRYYDKQDIAAAKQLVMSHLRFVVHIAKTYLGYGLAFADLIQEGNIGLMKAVQRFNPYVGVRLVTYAVHWIKAEIHEFIVKNLRMVKIARKKAERKLFFNLRQLKSRMNSLTTLTQDEIQSIAKELKVNPEEVVKMERRLSAIDTSFDTPDNEHEEKAYLLPANYLEDTASNPALQFENNNTQEFVYQKLREGLQKLDTRSQEILAKRWMVEKEKKATLEDLAQQYSVSKERIRQLENAAIAKLKTYLAEC
jgi:RNA polymerase sigma-32 factor